jgi:hypothetical protein
MSKSQIVGRPKIGYREMGRYRKRATSLCSHGTDGEESVAGARACCCAGNWPYKYCGCSERAGSRRPSDGVTVRWPRWRASAGVRLGFDDDGGRPGSSLRAWRRWLQQAAAVNMYRPADGHVPSQQQNGLSGIRALAVLVWQQRWSWWMGAESEQE